MMMGETQIAYLMLFTAPGMFAINMLVARWMANEAPPVALAFWRWFGVLLLMLMLRGNQLWQNRHFVLEEWKDLLVLGILGMGICGAFVYIGAETTAASNIGLLYSSSPVLITLRLLSARRGSVPSASKRRILCKSRWRLTSTIST